MQDDGLDSEALDAWNNPHKYINNVEYTPEELHAPLHTVLRKNIKTKLETYDYKKYRIVREEKNNKTIYVIEEIDLVPQPSWWRNLLEVDPLYKLQWSTYWFGYGSNKEPFTCLKDAEDYVNKLVNVLNKQQDDKVAPSKTIISVHP